MTERCTRLPRALLAACTLAVAVLALPGCSYNRFTSGEEAIKGAWGDVQNQLMRRNDLIPNLVETVKGVAGQEQAVFGRIAESAPPNELLDWLSSRTPEANTALVDSAKADPQAITASMTGLQANNIFNTFRSKNIPCLLVYGDRDPAITIPDEEFSLSTMTHQVELDASGHFPMIDETGKLNRLLTDFLALESGTSPRDLQMKDEWRRSVR